MTSAASPLPEPEAGDGAGGLADLLADWARRSPDALAFDDETGRASWSRRPPLAWTAAVADAMVSRLAAGLRRLGLAPGSSVAICLPGSSEACLAILAVERAGLLPCLVPLAWNDEEIARAMRSIEARAAITQAIVADLRPADTLRGIARDYLGLRCVAAFGPAVPDGVMDLDRVLVEESAAGPPIGPEPTAGGPGLVTFAPRRGERVPLYQSAAGLTAARLAIDAARPIGASDRILTLLAADDLAGLATGLAASLAARATLEIHGLFGAEALSRALQRAPATHVVAPASLEDVLAGALRAPWNSLTLVHGIPARFRRVGHLPGHVVDVVGLGEGALLAACRDPAGRCCLTIPHRDGCEPRAGGTPVPVARGEGGELFFRSGAATAQSFERGAMRAQSPASDWRPAGARVETLGDHLVAITFD